MDKVQYDLYSPDFSRHSYEIYRSIRQENPIFQQAGFDGHTPIWYLSRFEDVEAMLKDDEHFTLDYRRALNPAQAQYGRQAGDLHDMVNSHLLTKDGEDHRRLRALVSKAFTPARINGLRPRIQAVADLLIDLVFDQRKMDLVDAYAFPLPIIVIGELLGIPADDRNRFRAWSDIFVRPAISVQEQQAFGQMAREFVGYLQGLFEQRRKQPQDDLISALLQVEDEGERLSREELYSMVMLLIIAGHETTVTLIGNATLALLTHPAQRADLQAHPEQMAQAVEEFLRFDPPVDHAITRVVTGEVSLGGHTFQRGDLVIALLGSANRDEKEFSEPDRLEIERDNHQHIAFGRGVHYCLGAPLARLEGEIALNTLLRRLPGLRLGAALSELEYRRVPLFHSLKHIPVEW